MGRRGIANDLNFKKINFFSDTLGNICNFHDSLAVGYVQKINLTFSQVLVF